MFLVVLIGFLTVVQKLRDVDRVATELSMIGKQMEQMLKEFKYQNDWVTSMMTRHEDVPDLCSISEQLNVISSELSEQTTLLESYQTEK